METAISLETLVFPYVITLKSQICDSETFYVKKHNKLHHMQFMILNSGRNNIFILVGKEWNWMGQFVVLLSVLVNC
jgi:hypothetical protein